MATSEIITFRILLSIGALAVLGFIGLGILYLIGPRATVEQEPVLSKEAVYEEDVLRGRQSDMLEGAPEELILLPATVKRGEAAIEGSIMNNADRAYVNVQVWFELYAADSTRIGAAVDTTGMVEPGDTWRFHATLPEDVLVAEVGSARIQAVPTVMD